MLLRTSRAGHNQAEFIKADRLDRSPDAYEAGSCPGTEAKW